MEDEAFMNQAFRWIGDRVCDGFEVEGFEVGLWCKIMVFTLFSPGFHWSFQSGFVVWPGRPTSSRIVSITMGQGPRLAAEKRL